MNTKTKTTLSFLLALALAILHAAAAANTQDQSADLTRYVNPRQGSNSVRDFSTGNTYPATAVPWGMNYWTPQTARMGDGWQYSWDATTICGLKQTHQPSPWINDHGCFSIMPVTGDPKTKFPEQQRASRFTHAREISMPQYYAVDLDTYNIRAEMTPTSRAVAMRFTYPAGDKNKPASIIIDCYNKGGFIKIIPAENKIVGYSRYYSRNSSATLPANFATYFVITADRPIASFGTFNGNKRADYTAPDSATTATTAPEQTGDHVGAYITFAPAATGRANPPGEPSTPAASAAAPTVNREPGTVNLKIASSFISLAQAQLNLDREIGPRTFDQVRAAATDEWNRVLARVTINDPAATEEQLRTLYTALYRMALFPHAFHETDATGATTHYNPFDGTTSPGPLYTGLGLWDTYRAAYPFITITHPELTTDIMRSMANYAREGGWLPEWFNPGYLNCMIGQNSASIIADAQLKNLVPPDIAPALWTALTKAANAPGPNATGRAGAADYNRLGYVPNDTNVKESVSRTMEYAYDDYCIWRYGTALGLPPAETDIYRQRSANWRNILDTTINFIRPKNSAGQWESTATWRPDTWGGSFTEGCSWHWTWHVMHDPQGLANAMGGTQAFLDKLDSVFTAHPTFDERGYGHVIHEMTEMVALNMGQYAHGNEPIHHMLYLYAYAGAPWKTQQHVREVLARLYASGWADGKGLCGDEDTGQMSAWYVFSALGFYPVCPGSNEYIIGSPLHAEATLALPNNRAFTIRAKNNSPTNIYIQTATLNNRPLDRAYITHEEITAGGVLEFTMGPTPNKTWATSPAARPYSMTTSK